jgi:hypothetical protein
MNISQGINKSGRNSNTASPEYKSTTLPVNQPLRSYAVSNRHAKKTRVTKLCTQNIKFARSLTCPGVEVPLYVENHIMSVNQLQLQLG